MATAYNTNTYGACVYSLANLGSGEQCWMNSTTRTTNFPVADNKCKDGSDTIWVHPKLATALQQLRNAKYGTNGIKIRSAYRTKAYNDTNAAKNDGTAKNSEHIYGCAADIQPGNTRAGWTSSNLAWCDDAKDIYNNRSSYGITGVGLYDYTDNIGDSYIHIDVGPGSSGANMGSGYERDGRASFWYQWKQNPTSGNYCIYLYESAKISALLNGLRKNGGDPTLYISGLTGGSTRFGSVGGSSGTTYSPSFVNYPERTRLLQLYLKMRGWYTNSVDGSYGDNTGNAVKQFQSNNSLTPIDGDIAWNAGNTFPLMFPTLRNGDKDSGSAARTRNMNVKFMQKCLIALGYNLGSAGADGAFGGKSEDAIRAIQGTGSDGVCGPNTWQLIATRLKNSNITAV